MCPPPYSNRAQQRESETTTARVQHAFRAPRPKWVERVRNVDVDVAFRRTHALT